MIARELMGTAKIPGGNEHGGELRLFRRELKHADEFSIMLGRIELMNSRLSGSEEALATLSCERLTKPNPRVLIGGYGMGFTLRAALAVLPESAKIVVAELIPAILDWARGPMQELTNNCLDDPRVETIVGDVSAIIADAPSQYYDAILLDVDNGPDGLTQDDNEQLYGFSGLSAAKSALRGGGILAIWSSGADPAFTRRLQQSEFAVETKTVSARSNGKGAKHVIWLAQH